MSPNFGVGALSERVRCNRRHHLPLDYPLRKLVVSWRELVRYVMAKKNKTNKSIKKRLKRTASGKLKHGVPGKRHLNAHFTPKRRRQLRRMGVVTGATVKKYLIAMGEY